MATFSWPGFKPWALIKWSKDHLTFDLHMWDYKHKLFMKICKRCSSKQGPWGVQRRGPPGSTACFHPAKCCAFICFIHSTSEKIEVEETASLLSKNKWTKIFKPYVSLYCIDCFSDHLSIGSPQISGGKISFSMSN